MVLQWYIFVTVFSFPIVLSKDTTELEWLEEVGNTPCEIGWLHFGQKCYRRDGILKSYYEAAYSCTTYGGHLVSIHSKEELDFLVNYILLNYKYAMWIGLHNQAKESGFTWIDGSAVNYTNWMPGEPSHENENCVQMLYNHPAREDDVMGKWNDATCDLKYSYLCQKKIVPTGKENENLPNSPPVPTGKENENLPNSPPGGQLQLGFIASIVVLSVIVLILGISICYLCWRTKVNFPRSAERSSDRPIPYTIARDPLNQLPSNYYHYVTHNPHLDRELSSEYHIYEPVIHLSASETDDHYLPMK